MSVAQAKICGRCSKQIECRVNDIETCDCYKIKLSESTHDFLKETQYNCLCNDCLISVNLLVQEADSTTNTLTEDVHYYIENGLLVFKELYHIQRGYCCKSGCRHCAYGYKK